MSLFDAFRYDGKRVLVVGGATGMGAAAAELAQDAGAEVVVMDFADVKLAGRQGHPREPGRQGLDRRRGGRVRRPGARADGLRRRGRRDAQHREDQLRRAPPPDRSDAGRRHAAARARPSASSPRPPASGWEASWEQVKEYLDTPDFDSASAWAIEHGWADYFHSKQAVCGYVARQAFPLLKQGIRINAICPGPTDTPLAQANAEMWLGFGADYREETGIEASTPARAGLPARVPLQRRRRGHLGPDPDQRRRLHQLGHHRVVTRRPPRPPASCSAGCRRRRHAPEPRRGMTTTAEDEEAPARRHVLQELGWDVLPAEDTDGRMPDRPSSTPRCTCRGPSTCACPSSPRGRTCWPGISPSTRGPPGPGHPRARRAPLRARPGRRARSPEWPGW